MNRLKIIFLTFLFTLLPLVCCGQAKVYTTKVKLADFPVSTAKVVLDGSAEFTEALRESVLHFWRVSPYEFCSPEEYDKLKDDHSLYFLRPVEIDGTMCLVLSKGGKDRDPDNLKEAFNIVDMPVGDKYEHFGAFIDILQDFVTAAMESDRVAFAGLKYRNGPGSAQVRQLAHSAPERICRVIVGHCIITYDRDTHELCHFRK